MPMWTSGLQFYLVAIISADGHQEGLQPGCLRRLHGAGRRRAHHCLALAVQYQGRSIATIEGLRAAGALHPLQQAFVEHDGFQCGYCTPGQICSAVGMVGKRVKRGVPSHVTADFDAELIELTHDELRERMSGNLCRCGAYNGIVDAIHETFGDGRSAPSGRPPMTPFHYERASDCERGAALGERARAPSISAAAPISST